MFILRNVVPASLVIMLTLAGSVHAQEQESPRRDRNPEPIVFTVDVAEDMAGKFVPTMVNPGDTQPERGSFYVAQGRVFPEGTIEGDGASFDPYRMGHIGTWISRGTHLVSASEIPAASWWASTAQLFVLGRQNNAQIASEGLEGSGTLVRVVTGGAGNYAGFVGEQRVTLLGFNTTGGVNLRVTFVLRRVADER
jgi:hypothetical protein